MAFELFDPAMDLRITVGHLPHWFQPGVTYFLTFRTDDSIPVALGRLWQRRRDEWLRRHGIDPWTEGWRLRLESLAIAQQREFHNTFSREFMEYLDCGYGECVLKQSHLATIVADSLRHDDGQRYLTGDFVVMPNHVHLLTCLLNDTDCQKQCYSWKKYTATQINRFQERRGRFWQEETFDHLVRSPEQFEYLRRYIAENPSNVGLRQNECLYWRREDISI